MTGDSHDMGQVIALQRGLVSVAGLTSLHQIARQTPPSSAFSPKGREISALRAGIDISLTLAKSVAFGEKSTRPGRRGPFENALGMGIRAAAGRHAHAVKPV